MMRPARVVGGVSERSGTLRGPFGFAARADRMGDGIAPARIIKSFVHRLRTTYWTPTERFRERIAQSTSHKPLINPRERPDEPLINRTRHAQDLLRSARAASGGSGDAVSRWGDARRSKHRSGRCRQRATARWRPAAPKATPSGEATGAWFENSRHPENLRFSATTRRASRRGWGFAGGDVDRSRSDSSGNC